MVDSRKASQRDRRHPESTWADMPDMGKKMAWLVAEDSGHKTTREAGVQSLESPHGMAAGRKEWSPACQEGRQLGTRTGSESPIAAAQNVPNSTPGSIFRLGGQPAHTGWSPMGGFFKALLPDSR